MLRAAVCLLKLFKVAIFAKGINRTHMFVSLLLVMLVNIRDGFSNKMYHHFKCTWSFPLSVNVHAQIIKTQEFLLKTS